MKSNTFWFIYKIIAFLIIFGFIITSYIILMVNKDWGPNNNNHISFAYGEFTMAFLTFFTTQSNLIVAFYFLWAAIKHKKEEKYLTTGRYAKIFVTSYISVTGTIWIIVLLPAMLIQGYHSTGAWILEIEPHIIAPAIMIIYSIYHLGYKKIPWKSYLQKELWFYISYPIIYIIAIMLRGEMRWWDGKGNLSYPYFFLNIHQKILELNGPVGFIIFFFIILALFFVYNFLYVAVNNRRAKKVSYF